MEHNSYKIDAYIGEQIYIKTLDFGLTVYLMPKKHFAKKYAFFATHFGGIHSAYTIDGKIINRPHGAAHFLEHQIFEDKDKSSFERFEEIGANLNAYTSNTSTVYHFDTVDHFEQGIKMLIDMVQETEISDASVIKEKEVIIQEIRMYMDEPLWDLSSNLYNGMYYNHPIKTDIAGTIESVKALDKEAILSCYEHFYAPNNMSLFLYGDFDHERLFEHLQDMFSDEYKNRTSIPKLWLPEEPVGIQYREKNVVKDISKGSMLLGFKGQPFEEKDKEHQLVALKMANDLMFGRSSAFFMSCYNKGLISDAFDFDVQMGEGYAHAVVGNETDQIDALYDAILQEMQRHLNEGFNPQDFERMKKKALGRTIASFNSLQSIANNYTQSVMRGINLFKQMDVYKHITLEDVYQTMQRFYNMDHHTLSSLTKGKIEKV